MLKKSFPLLILLVYLLPGRAGCQVRSYQTTVNMQVAFAPAMVTIGGRLSVYYELHLTNFAKDTIEINSLAILNAANSSVISKLDDVGLRKHFMGIGKPANAGASFLPPGASGVIFLEVSLPDNTEPISLTHQLMLNILKNSNKTAVVITGAVTKVKNKPPVILGSPLAAGPWAAVYDPLWATGHRRVFYTVDGTARLPGRFAIDFIRIDSVGKVAEGDENVTRNWHGYAADVLAVHDGIIASVRNDSKESPTLSGHPPVLAENATGNYISLKIGEKQYVFYEHLKPGSIKVKPGQKVTKGRVIASLGFTGQSTGPHLHLHVADKDSPLGAEGIPFEFEHYRLLGDYTDFNNFGKTPWMPAKKRKANDIRNERPASNSVIEFIPLK
jgi:murein DD-endopeptidase